MEYTALLTEFSSIFSQNAAVSFGRKQGSMDGMYSSFDGIQGSFDGI